MVELALILARAGPAMRVIRPVIRATTQAMTLRRRR